MNRLLVAVRVVKFADGEIEVKAEPQQEARFAVEDRAPSEPWDDLITEATHALVVEKL